MFNDRRLLLIFVMALVDVVAAGALGALLNKFVIDLPAKPVLLTGGTALMLAIQLGFSPAIGHWSDKIGRRPAVIATTIFSLLSSLFLLPVQAWGYVANRVSKGATNGLYAVLRSSVADLTKGEELVKYSGLLSFIVGGGAFLGPMVGALLLIPLHEARHDALPLVILMLALCGLNIVLALFYKETNDKPKEKVTFSELKDKAISAFKIRAAWSQLSKADEKVPGSKSIFILNMLATLGFGYYAFFVAFLTQSDLAMEPLDTAYFFLYFGGLACLANIVFFRYIVSHVNKRKTVIAIVLLSILVQIGYCFSESSVTLLYVVAGVDALTVSIIGGLIGGMLTNVTQAGGGQGEQFGTIQGLGGLASFVTALVNTLLSGVSMKAPFIFCALSSVVVVWWTLRLPEEARKYTDRTAAERKQDEAAEAKPASA
ncbi:MFS transporter [Spirosoma validum]|uniref:MFS transporter n=1 Tax=Spirosoma validum TaxID=2771355 RepID=A0A927GG33_9BACT|nr:MFS transporter [Spirosoma validum]MBD2756459.1 MFS transporter [Spirosoma validum]